MANSDIVIINVAYNNGHSESVSRPGPRFTAGNDLFNCSKGCSPLGVSTAQAIGEISVLSVALKSLQIDPSFLFFLVAVHLLLTRAKPL